LIDKSLINIRAVFL